MSSRVLTWNLFHGRSLPPSRRSLAHEFSALLAGWDWDVALLQEVPPWWAQSLADRCGAEQRTVLTSRNAGLALRGALARRQPELLKSNGGGANVVLARSPIVAHRAVRLRLWPERRVAQLIRLADGICVANCHASTRVALAERELVRLWDLALGWAAGAPLILGGDLNLRAPSAPEDLARHVARRDVDHLFAVGMERCGESRVLERRVLVDRREIELSDHPPLLVEL
jgi:endonuclease/exonuclease/phosphatase family metal-dependent hydrolase